MLYYDYNIMFTCMINMEVQVIINKCYKILDEHQKDLIPKVILEKYGG